MPTHEVLFGASLGQWNGADAADALPHQVRLNLALAEERRFGGGTVYVYYRPA